MLSPPSDVAQPEEAVVSAELGASVSVGEAQEEEEHGVTPPDEVPAEEDLQVPLQPAAQADARPELLDEPRADANEVYRNLDDLQKQLTQDHGLLETQSSESGTATIASTAAHVKQISLDLQELQDQLALSYPMTDEEKAACRLPAVSLQAELRARKSALNEEIPYRGSALSLADACSVLRGVAKHSHAAVQPVDKDSLVNTAPVLDPTLTLTDDALEPPATSNSAKSRNIPDSMEVSAAAGNCGADLRRATQVLQRRLRKSYKPLTLA